MLEPKKISKRVDLIGSTILLIFFILATLFLVFNFIYVYFWPPTYTISESTIFFFTGDNYFKIVDSSAPVKIEIINIDDFFINVKANSQTKSYDATPSGNIYRIETIASLNNEYQSPFNDTKAIISSPAPFVIEESVKKESILLYGFGGIAFLSCMSIFFFFQRRQIKKKDS